jgi:hypothetical protein
LLNTRRAAHSGQGGGRHGDCRAHVERAARQVDREQLAAARAASDKAIGELVELARRFAAIAESNVPERALLEPPRRSVMGRTWRWLLRN